MPWAVAAAAVAAGGAIYSANKQAGAAKDAANASNQATQQSIAEQKREFDINQANQAPWLNAGKGALSQMQALNGGDFSSFTQSPDYQFALDQGQGALDRDAAARGSLFSGGHSTDVMKFAQGLASQNYNNYYNRLAGLAGVGQTSANQLGAAGQNYANGVSGLLMGNAQNQMGSIYNRANAYSNMASQFGQIGGNLAGQFYQPNYGGIQTYQAPMQISPGTPSAQPNFQIGTPAVGGAPNPTFG